MPAFPMKSGIHPKSVDITKDDRKELIHYPQEALLHLPSRTQNACCLKLNYSSVSSSRQHIVCTKEAASSSNRQSRACHKDIAISDYRWSLHFKVFNFSRHPFSVRERTTYDSQKTNFLLLSPMSFSFWRERREPRGSRVESGKYPQE